MIEIPGKREGETQRFMGWIYPGQKGIMDPKLEEGRIQRLVI